MNKDEIKTELLNGSFLQYHVWTFWETGMTCSDEHQCCDIGFENIAECIEHIGFLCGGSWGDISKCEL